MVDSINGAGPVQGLNRTQSSQNTQNKQETRESREVRDEVSISPEALSLSQAEQTSVEVRHQLADDRGASLGLDPNFDESV